jgi:hypothetical protein
MGTGGESFDPNPRTMTHSLTTNQYGYPVRWDFTPKADGNCVNVRHSRWYASTGWVCVADYFMSVLPCPRDVRSSLG